MGFRIQGCLITCSGPARRHYERELAAYDVQTRRCDVYGQDSGYPLRGMLIYDGLHYDALALAGALRQGRHMVSLFWPSFTGEIYGNACWIACQQDSCFNACLVSAPRAECVRHQINPRCINRLI